MLFYLTSVNVCWSCLVSWPGYMLVRLLKAQLSRQDETLAATKDTCAKTFHPNIFHRPEQLKEEASDSAVTSQLPQSPSDEIGVFRHLETEE